MGFSFRKHNLKSGYQIHTQKISHLKFKILSKTLGHRVL